MSCLSGPAKTTVRESDRIRAGCEVALFLTFVLLMAWTLPRVTPQLRFYCGATLLTWIFGLTIMSHLSYRESLADLGFSGEHTLRAVRELVKPVGLLTILLVIIGLALGTLDFDKKFISRIIGIPFWALFQQYAAQSFVNRRLQIVFGRGNVSIIITALIFASVHLPNPALTAATALSGFVWARAYQRAPDLYAISITHGLLSALFVTVMPKWILPNMVVGYNYLLK